MQPQKQLLEKTPLSKPNDFLLSAYHENLDHATRNACALEDDELIKALSSAKKCYHIFKSRNDETTAQFFQLYYWQIKAQISLCWRGI